MANFLQNLFKAADQSVIGIDVGSSSVKVVQLRKKKGRAVLETYGELALGPYAGLAIGQSTNLPAEKIAEAIRDLIREANVTTPSAGISIPFKSSLLSLIELPHAEPKQLQEMIPLEARKYIPVPISEVTMDWWIVPNEEDREHDLDFVEGVDEDNNQLKDSSQKKVQVLVVSIHNDVLSTYTKIVEQSKIQASFFEIEMFSSTRALLSGETAPILIFDMGASSTKVYILERGVVKYSHIINKGSQDITMSISKGLSVTFDRAEHMKRNLGSTSSAEEKNVFEIISLTLDYIFSEANTVLMNYQRKFNKTINKVILTGGGVAMKGVYELARSNFQTEVVMGDPFNKVETPAFLEGVLKVTGLEFSTALGLALRKLQELG
jgi:type IV pilus assembly protein PilM